MAAEAEDPNVEGAAQGDDDDDQTKGYKAPEKKTLDEITKLDQDDESLVKYKQALLGASAGGASDVLGEEWPYFCLFLSSLPVPFPAACTVLFLISSFLPQMKEDRTFWWSRSHWSWKVERMLLSI